MITAKIEINSKQKDKIGGGRKKFTCSLVCTERTERARHRTEQKEQDTEQAQNRTERTRHIPS